MKITIPMIREYDPCYEPTSKYGITEDMTFTLAEWMDYEQLPPEDRVWLASRFMTDRQNRTFAIWCVRSIKHDCHEVNEFIDTIEGYYLNNTHTKEQMMDAEKAACAVVEKAACYSACCSADVACWAASWAAYWAADIAACWASDCPTVCREDQVDKIKQIISCTEASNG